MIELSRRSFIGGVASVLLVRPGASFKSPVLALALPDPAVRVEAGGQQGGILVLQPLKEPLFVGDVITIEGVKAYSAHYPITERLREFVVTKQAEVGERLLCLYPYIVPMDLENPDANRYATVQSLPARGAEIKLHPPTVYWRVQGTGANVTYTRME